MGPTVGIRETRRFEGVHKLTEDDIFAGKKFSDSVVLYVVIMQLMMFSEVQIL